MKSAFLLIAILGLANIAARPRLEPTVYHLTSVWGPTASRFSQVGGGEVSLPTAAIRGNRVQFVDLMPGANWKHPAKYQVINPEGVVVEELAVELPPHHLSTASVISGPAARWNRPAQIRLNDFKGSLRVSNPQNHFAFLLNGHADQRHWNDFSFLYQVLTKIYGYDPKNIIVADGAFKTSQPDLDGDGNADIQFGSTRADLVAAFKQLQSMVTAQDDLVFAVNDHGSTQGGESTIVLYDTEIKASEFATLFKGVAARKVISIFEQCFSGGFVKPATGSNRIAMSAASDSEYSWATKDLMFDEFIYHVIAAFAKQDHNGNPIGSDLDRDGKVTVKEAFAYAVGKDVADESPQMLAASNSGDSSSHGLGF